jgi:hypothetical protein
MLSGQTEGQYLAQVETKHPSLIPYKWISISWSEREKIGSKVDKKKKKSFPPQPFLLYHLFFFLSPRWPLATTTLTTNLTTTISTNLAPHR